MQLRRGDVLDGAMAILDEYGLGDLTMRKLATSLGVQPGALYWHFPNKQTLLGAMADRILDASMQHLPPTRGTPHSTNSPTVSAALCSPTATAPNWSPQPTPRA